MDKTFSAILVAAALVLAPGVLCAAPLAKTSQEYAQLQAMGYDVDPTEPNDTWTVAKSGGARIVVSQEGASLSFGRYFTREKRSKDLSQEQKLQLLTEVNQVNIDMSYQVSVGEEYLSVALYYTGPYNAKVFANIVRLLESSNVIFDKYPQLFKLLSK